MVTLLSMSCVLSVAGRTHLDVSTIECVSRSPEVPRQEPDFETTKEPITLGPRRLRKLPPASDIPARFRDVIVTSARPWMQTDVTCPAFSNEEFKLAEGCWPAQTGHPHDKARVSSAGNLTDLMSFVNIQIWGRRQNSPRSDQSPRPRCPSRGTTCCCKRLHVFRSAILLA